MSTPAYDPEAVARPSLVSVVPVSDARSEFLRRATSYDVEPGGTLVLGGLAVDTDVYAATVDGAPVDLSPRQIELLAIFLSAPGRVWSREQLHWICWGDMTPSRRVDVQLCRIRSKVGIDLFRNIRDRGWALHTV